MVKGMADFSLHIVPDYLDLLSREFAHESDQCAMELGPHLEVLFDDIDRGAFQVDDQWVSYAAAVPKAAARSITQRWFDKMGQKYSDAKIEITEAGVKAVDDLLELCKRAKREGQTVLYVWFG